MLLPSIVVYSAATVPLVYVMTHIGSAVAGGYWSPEGGLKDATLHVFGEDPAKVVASFPISQAV